MATPSTGQRHTWTPDDDARLEAAVTALAASTLKGTRIWHAVCGRLAPELCVSPDAASSRYEKLARLRKDAAEAKRAEEDAKMRAAEERLAAGEKNLQWRATIDRWAEQWDDCPCGDMLPDAPDSTMVVCRHCGRMWEWKQDWRLDFDSDQKAEAEEAWTRTMKLVELHEGEEEDAIVATAVPAESPLLAALARNQATLDAIDARVRALQEMWR